MATDTTVSRLHSTEAHHIQGGFKDMGVLRIILSLDNPAGHLQIRRLMLRIKSSSQKRSKSSAREMQIFVPKRVSMAPIKSRTSTDTKECMTV